MKIRKDINAQFVNTAAHTKEIWRNMLNLFMKIRKPTYVQFAIMAAHKNGF